MLKGREMINRHKFFDTIQTSWVIWIFHPESRGNFVNTQNPATSSSLFFLFSPRVFSFPVIPYRSRYNRHRYQ